MIPSARSKLDGISLLFGLASSTLLTALVIPAIYVVLRGDSEAAPQEETI